MACLCLYLFCPNSTPGVEKQRGEKKRRKRIFTNQWASSVSPLQTQRLHPSVFTSTHLSSHFISRYMCLCCSMLCYVIEKHWQHSSNSSKYLMPGDGGGVAGIWRSSTKHSISCLNSLFFPSLPLVHRPHKKDTADQTWGTILITLSLSIALPSQKPVNLTFHVLDAKNAREFASPLFCWPARSR